MTEKFKRYRRGVLCTANIALLILGTVIFAGSGLVSDDVETASYFGGNNHGSLHMVPCPVTSPACNMNPCLALAGPPIPGGPFPIGWVCNASEFRNARVEYPMNLQGAGPFDLDRDINGRPNDQQIHCADVRTCTGNCAPCPGCGGRFCSGATPWRPVNYQAPIFNLILPLEVDGSGNPIPPDPITRPPAIPQN